MPNRKIPAPHPRAGFTLVELLTVVAILGLLAALLLPITTGARSKADEVVAISNLRQIHAAILASANESDGRFPFMKNYSWDAPSGVSGTFPYMQQALEPYLGPQMTEKKIQEIFRNPVVLSNGTPEWLQEPEHNHFRYNVLTAPGKRPKDPSEAIVLFDTVWPDWPEEDLPYLNMDGERCLRVVTVDGEVHLMTYEEYQELTGGSESKTSDFFAKGWTR